MLVVKFKLKCGYEFLFLSISFLLESMMVRSKERKKKKKRQEKRRRKDKKKAKEKEKNCKIQATRFLFPAVVFGGKK
jgi:hypothetical protein